MNILSLGLLATLGAGIIQPPREITFNLRRDNDNDALKSANLKIMLAQEKNKRNKELRLQKRLSRYK